jgi:hypothetical protein
MRLQILNNKNALVAAAVITFVLAHPVQAGPGNQGNPGVLPPNSTPFGLTYGQWSTALWQWTFSQPVSQNPLFMNGDVDLSLGQPAGPVWFLGGIISLSPFGGSANRTGTIPAGKALFFPLIDVEWDNGGTPFTTFTVSQLRAFAKAVIDGADDITCEIDGVPLLNLSNPLTTAYRVVSPVFSYALPATDNLAQFFGIDIWGTVGPAVADGIYVMLAPLPVGRHTIHFTAGFSTSPFMQDITYNLTVK